MLRKLFSGQRTLDKIPVKLSEYVTHISVCNGLDLIKYQLIVSLGHRSFGRITASSGLRKKLFKNISEIELSAPAEILGKWNSYAVSVINL